MFGNGKTQAPPSDLPPHLVGKVCPHFPARPKIVPDPRNIGHVTLDPTQLEYTGCLGENCAKYVHCQGDYSPGALHDEVLDLVDTLKDKLEKLTPILERARKLPFLRGLFPD